MKFILFLSTLFSASLSHAMGAKAIPVDRREGPVTITFDGLMPQNQKDLITEDLEFLNQQKIQMAEKSMELFELEKNSKSELQDWLSNRLKYIFAEKTKIHRRIKILEESASYPFPDVFPPFFDLDKNIEVDVHNHLEDSDKGSVVMSNIGGVFYLQGKILQAKLAMKLSDKSLVPVQSPRIGAVMVGEGLFSNFKNPNLNRVAKIFRLETYFHEARHSDGQGLTLLFPHVKCPKGHQYEGALACDVNLNGPYTVGAHLLLTYKKALAHEFEAQESDLIDTLIADNLSRQIPEYTSDEGVRYESTWWNPNPEFLDNE